MSLTPLLQSDMAIQIHAFSAIFAVVIGAFVLWRKKGTALHKVLGRLWVVLMLVAATSALFIHELRLVWLFSPIHLFSVLTYLGISRGLYAIIVKRDVAGHRAEMQGVYLGALMLAGAFTFLPGRRMHEVVFGPDAGWTESLLTIGIILLLSLYVWLRMRRRALTQSVPLGN